MTDASLTTTDLIAAATRILTEAGYAQIALGDIPTSTAVSRYFEDTYGVVAVAVYSTWSDLATNWFEAQSQLVDLLSRNLTQGDPKAWEGYLVLLTPSLPPTPDADAVDAIRYDTSRTRKFVATGESLATLNDVERVLSPLLPITAEPQSSSDEAVLEHLPSLLAAKGIDSASVQRIISAYRAQRPLLEALDEVGLP